jgi:hypothetical protein
VSEPIDASIDAVVLPPDFTCGSTGDELCEPNDKPAGAIDATGGGTFKADLLHAHDDLPSLACNLDGGNEVFYQVVLASPEVYAFDTFGTPFDTSVRVFPGTACTAVTPDLVPTCDDDECGTDQSQLAVPLPAGASCVVVDKNFNNGRQANLGMFQLAVVRGGRTGTALPPGAATLFGNTCDAAKTSSPPTTAACFASPDADDIAYYFLACPNTPAVIDASTCADVTQTHFDTVLYIDAADGTNLACTDDTPGCAVRPDRADGVADGSKLVSISTTEKGLHWLVIDGSSGACGRYRLDTNYR